MAARIDSSHTIPTYGKLAAAVSAAVTGIAPAVAQEDAREKEELIITSGRSGDVSVQDYVGSVEAFSTEDLKRQQLFTLQDYARFTPSMEYFGNQGGSGKIFFRGVADAPDTFIAGSSAALYLDEQPLTQSAQVDVRAIDIERIEALAGPQGTLFGSSAQSGLLRIITRKPDPNNFSAFADVTMKTIDDGDGSYDVSGMLNLPLMDDRLALRIVGFTAEEGGYIDNVRGTTPVSDTDQLNTLDPDDRPTEKRSINGQQFNDGTRDNPNTGANEDNPNIPNAVDKDWNGFNTVGGRIAVKWLISDDWAATLGASFQNNESDAENTYDPTVGDLQTIGFYADTFEDEWAQVALTFEGDVGFANFVSATAYFTRDTTYTQDTTSYSAYFGSFCYYGTQTYNIYCFQPEGVGYFYNDPIGFLVNDQENTMFTQEFRLFNQGERINWVAGLFYEKRKEAWDFDTSVLNDDGYNGSQGYANWRDYWQVPVEGNPVTRDTNTQWFSADDTEWTTWAAYGELTFKFTDKFSGTVGARWFNVEMDKTYYAELPKGRLTPADTDKWACLTADQPCTLDADPSDTGFTNPTSEDDDVAWKFALDYKITDDIMVYGLYSEGFRPGGTNRGRGTPFYPVAYAPDYLKNYEAGVKSAWIDGRVVANLTYFNMKWDDYQLEVVDPSNLTCGAAGAPSAPACSQPWQKVITNVGNATSEGVEAQLDTNPVNGIDLGISATFLDARVDDDVPELQGVSAGTPLPFAPDLKAAAYAQYTWPMRILGTNEWFARLQGAYTDDSVNQVQVLVGGNTPQETMKSYTTWDWKVGMVADSWEFNLFMLNAGDERGEIFHDNTDFEPFWGRQRVAVIRPREFGVRFIYNWGE